MKNMPSSSVDLVYLDPPVIGGDRLVSSNPSNKKPFDFIKMLRSRVIEVRRILKDDGSLFCQIDSRVDKGVQILLDEIFGERNLIAKIIWQHSNATSTSKYLSHTYDVIMFYGKTRKVKYFPQYATYSDNEKVALYKYTDSETGKRYRLVGLTRPNAERSNFTYEFLGITRNWRFSMEKMKNELKQGRIVQSKPGAVPMYKQYMGEGKPLGDIWTDLPMVSVSKEMIGYPTQKPLALLERIISMSTQEGDLVFDPFCGSGTSLVAAEKLGRQWFGIDVSPTACQIASQRLHQIDNESSEKLFQLQDSRTLKDVRNMPHYEFESWAITTLEKLLINDPKFAQSKGLEPISNIKVYSIAKDVGFDMELESLATSVPVIVKRMEKIAAREISNFAIQLKHHNRDKGLFVAISFSKDALEEIKKKQLDGFYIIPIRANDLLLG
jgi:site-specific DNA-methyltransferase (adenine-specific)